MPHSVLKAVQLNNNISQASAEAYLRRDGRIYSSFYSVYSWMQKCKNY